jgi:hypothetical protein
MSKVRIDLVVTVEQALGMSFVALLFGIAVGYFIH